MTDTENIIFFKYDVDTSNLKVVKTEEEQYNLFFHSGHPPFLIPDFNKEKEDIWTNFMDFLEKTNDNEIYDQNGGEITDIKILDKSTGLTSCKYTANDIMLDEDADYQDYELDIEGYVIDQGDESYFIATSVKIF